MNCKEFKNQLASLEQPDTLPPAMHEHIGTCASCRSVWEKTQMLFSFVTEEKTRKVSPFVTTRIMAEIEDAGRPSGVLGRPVLVSVLSVFLLLLGFFSASLFTNPQPSALADSTENIATDYFFSDNPGSQLEEIWLNTYTYE